MTHRIDDTSTRNVAFALRPKDKGDVFTDGAAQELVGKTTTVRRLDGSSVESKIEGARLMDDGRCLVLTVAVPGGIDRAPREGVDTAG